MAEQVKVVSKGMKWSQKAADTAAQQHQYIKIGDKPGHLYITGAATRWTKPEHAADVYVPSLRVAGNPNTIRSLFLSMGVPAATIDSHLQRAFTAQNYKVSPFKESFDAEVRAYNEWRKSHDAQKKAQAGEGVTLNQLQYFVDQLAAASASAVARTTAAGSPKAGASPGRATRVGDLATRIETARQKGKVLDVTKMDPVRETGIKMIAPPGPNSKKIGVEGLPIVSSDAAMYAQAVGKLGDKYRGYIQRYNEKLNQGKVLAPPATMPAPVPALAPVQMQVPQMPNANSPLAGGVSVPTIPGVVGGLPTTLPVVASPIGSPGN